MRREAEAGIQAAIHGRVNRRRFHRVGLPAAEQRGAIGKTVLRYHSVEQRARHRIE